MRICLNTALLMAAGIYPVMNSATALAAPVCTVGTVIEFRLDESSAWTAATVTGGPDTAGLCRVEQGGQTVSARPEQLRPAGNEPAIVKLTPEARVLPPTTPQSRSPWPW